MFAAVRGTHIRQPGQTVTTVIEIGAEIPAELTVTKIVAVAPTHIEAFMASCDPGAFAGAA
jgi:hypothetical protein